MRLVSVTKTESALYFFVLRRASTVFSLLAHALICAMTLYTYISGHRGCLLCWVLGLMWAAHTRLLAAAWISTQEIVLVYIDIYMELR